MVTRIKILIVKKRNKLFMQYYILDSHLNYNFKWYLLSSNNSAAFHSSEIVQLLKFTALAVYLVAN